MFSLCRHLFLYSTAQYFIKLLVQEICHFAQSPTILGDSAWQYRKRKIKVTPHKEKI